MAVTEAEILTALGWTADEAKAAKLRNRLLVLDADIAAILTRRGEFAVTSQAKEEAKRTARAGVQAELDALGKAGA
jgi:hypothetical protein